MPAGPRPVRSSPSQTARRFGLRFTAVFVREDGAWKLVHLHDFYPVPDEVAVRSRLVGVELT